MEEWCKPQASVTTGERETDFSHEIHSFLQVATLSLLG